MPSASHALRFRPFVLAVSTPISMMTSGALETARLARCLNALPLDVGKHIRSTGSFEHVVQEADRAAGVNAPQCFGVAAEDKDRPRPWPPCDPLPHVGNVTPRCDPRAPAPALPLPTRVPSSRNGRGDVREAGMLIREHRDASALELRAQIGLSPVDHDQIRLQRDDALDVRIDEAANLDARLRLGGYRSKLPTPMTAGPRPWRTASLSWRG